MKTRTLLLAAVTAAALTMFAAAPTIEFTVSGVNIGGVPAGTKVAWLGMIRERVNEHVRVRFVRGSGPATPSGKLEIPETANTVRALWVVAELGTGSARRAAAPGFAHPAEEIVIHAAAGASTISIESASVELLYVRPNGGSWSFGTADGWILDADGASNGTVVMSLASLQRLQGNPHPPESVQAGDVILVIDPYRVRSSQLAVNR